MPVIITKWVVNPICKLWWQPCSFTPSYRRPAIIERKFSYETIKAWNLLPNFHPSLSLRAAESFCPSGLPFGFAIRTAEHPTTLSCCYPHHIPEVKQWHNLCCSNRSTKSLYNLFKAFTRCVVEARFQCSLHKPWLFSLPKPGSTEAEELVCSLPITLLLFQFWWIGGSHIGHLSKNPLFCGREE